MTWLKVEAPLVTAYLIAYTVIELGELYFIEKFDILLC